MTLCFIIFIKAAHCGKLYLVLCIYWKTGSKVDADHDCSALVWDSWMDSVNCLLILKGQSDGEVTAVELSECSFSFLPFCPGSCSRASLSSGFLQTQIKAWIIWTWTTLPSVVGEYGFATVLFTLSFKCYCVSFALLEAPHTSDGQEIIQK